MKKITSKKLQETGITLIALIITIVILLILAGITISTLSQTNIFVKSKKATDEYKNSQANEINTLAEYEQALSDYTKGGTTDTPTVPDSIKVGDEFKYTPKADDSFTVPEYAGVNDGSVATLSTESLTWKVWKKTSDSILITPTKPTTATLKLAGADGYNNAVQALNAYCRKYYSDTANGIKARNVNMNDIESSMTEAGKTARDSFSNGTYKYGETGKPSTKTNYPGLYASETDSNLGLSDSPNKDDIYAKFTGTSFNSDGETKYSNGYKQTFYSFSNSDLTSKKYYDDTTLELLFSETGCGIEYGYGYWVDSRCVDINSDYAYFAVRLVYYDSGLDSAHMLWSDGQPDGDTAALRPVVSIPASKISAYVGQ